MVLVIPAVDVMEGSCVRLVRGSASERKAYGDPVDAAMRFMDEGAEWIHLVDLDAAMGHRDNLELLIRIVEEVDVKVEVAGGVRSVNRAYKLVEAGASKVVLGTSAVRNPPFIEDVSNAIGTERVAVAVDVKMEVVMIEGWTRGSGLNYRDILETLNEYSFANVVVTSVEDDGTLRGPNLNLIKDSVRISRNSIYAAGGVRSVMDIKSLSSVGAEGIIVGKALYEGSISLKKALVEVGDC